jgi:hypothetical protein
MTTRTDVTIRPTAVVVDVSDLDREIGFWTALLAMGVSNRSEDWADLEPPALSKPALAGVGGPGGQRVLPDHR